MCVRRAENFLFFLLLSRVETQRRAGWETGVLAAGRGRLYVSPFRRDWLSALAGKFGLARRGCFFDMTSRGNALETLETAALCRQSLGGRCSTASAFLRRGPAGASIASHVEPAHVVSAGIPPDAGANPPPWKCLPCSILRLARAQCRNTLARLQSPSARSASAASASRHSLLQCRHRPPRYDWQPATGQATPVVRRPALDRAINRALGYAILRNMAQRPMRPAPSWVASPYGAQEQRHCTQPKPASSVALRRASQRHSYPARRPSIPCRSKASLLSLGVGEALPHRLVAAPVAMNWPADRRWLARHHGKLRSSAPAQRWATHSARLPFR